MITYKIIKREKSPQVDPLEYSAPYAVVGAVGGAVIREFLRREDAYQWVEFKLKQGE